MPEYMIENRKKKVFTVQDNDTNSIYNVILIKDFEAYRLVDIETMRIYFTFFSRNDLFNGKYFTILEIFPFEEILFNGKSKVKKVRVIE